MKMNQKNNNDHPWAKLHSKKPNFNDHLLLLPTYSIGRNAQNNIVINDKKLSNHHCQIQKTQNQIIVKDLSSNGTFIGNLKIGKGNMMPIKNNQDLWLLHQSKVGSQSIGYTFILLQEPKQTQVKNKQKEQQKQKKNIPASLIEQVTCSFCLEIMYLPVSVHPCNHRFCGACLTMWTQKNTICPQCRKQINEVVRDAAWNSILEQFLKENKELGKNQQQKADDNKVNKFNYESFKIGKQHKQQQKKKNKRQRRERLPNIDLNAYDHHIIVDDQLKCKQCINPINGYKCSNNVRHLQCSTCGQKFPDRRQDNFAQQCIICQSFFCNLYIGPCLRNGLKLVLIRNIANKIKVDVQSFRNNVFEYELFNRYKNAQKLKDKDIFNYMFRQYITKNKFKYLIDQKINKTDKKKEIEIGPDTSLCQACIKEVTFQLIFVYVKEVARKMYEAGIRDRADCYWGINCKTMNHNTEHARKLNHICFQSRFDK